MLAVCTVAFPSGILSVLQEGHKLVSSVVTTKEVRDRVFVKFIMPSISRRTSSKEIPP